MTGLEWMGDDLLVLTWGDDDGDPSSVTAAGEVWKLSGVKDADDPADVTRTQIAESLREPMGIKVVDGDIYVSEKHQLSKLIDADADGTYEAKDEIATWPFDGNFHEFAFGLLYKDGYFYVNLSVSIDLGGATTVPQGSDDRGMHLKVAKDTGAIEYVAGGLRTPHGIGWGPEDEIFVTDNQGGWLPANKLDPHPAGQVLQPLHDRPERRPAASTTSGPTPPALWLPHNEIANSPSQPMLIPDGPFAGQMWIADVTYGGIQRAFLEKVEGEYQGAYFRMTQGLESGITHMLLEDDGSIIVGGLGAGGNWGQDGQAAVRPPEARPERHRDVRHPEDGARRRRLRPDLHEAAVGRRRVGRPGREVPRAPVEATSRRRTTAARRSARRTLTVTGATVSEDGKTVSLEDRRPQAEPRRLRALAAAVRGARAASELLSTEAWYTLNTLPGYVAPVSDGLYELEDGLLTGGAQFDTEHAGYSGTGFVSGFGTVGASVKVDVNAAKAGDYRMALRYANGPNPFEGPKTVSADRQRREPADHAALDRRRGRTTGSTSTTSRSTRARTRSSSRTRTATSATSTSTRCGSRPRASRATRRRRRRSAAARTCRPSTPATAARATSAATRTRARARRSR